MRNLHIGKRGRTVLATASLVAGVAGMAGLASATPAVAGTASQLTAQSASRHAPPPHIMTIMMENTDYSQFAGSAAMPYLNQIAHEYADFTKAWGYEYPSLPNYLDLLSGTDPGPDEDCDITQANCSNYTNTTLVDQLEKAKISWNAYYQGDPSGCYQGDGSGNYPYWHNAFRYFKNFKQQCSHISGFGDLLSNLKSSKAADFQWVVPDLVGSGGDNGTMASGDSWLNGELPKIMDTSWYREGGQIVILYDTGYNDAGGTNGSSGGQIPMIVVSAHTRGMGAVNTPINTSGVLRSIEKAYDLPYLANAADAKNGTLGKALVSSRPGVSSRPAHPVSVGAAVGITGDTPHAVAAIRGTISVNGIARIGSGSSAPVLEVGQNASGQGVVVAPGKPARVVAGTSNLQSVSCTTGKQCYAVGLGALNSDEAVLVSIVNGKAAKVTGLPAFIGLYGISCPTASTCYAVGYDNANDADAVTTIASGKAGAPVEVTGGGEWLNSISCASHTECYAAGLVNYNPSIVPIASGQPGAAVTIPDAWYVNGIDCTSVGNCMAVGENSTEQGIVGTLVNGAAGTTTVVKGTEYLYGVGCASAASCVVTGAGTPGRHGYSSGVVAPVTSGVPGKVKAVANANGFGQVVPHGKDGYLAVGAAYTAWPHALAFRG